MILQMTIEDYMIDTIKITQQIIPFEVKDQVRIVIPDIEADSEAHYYLQKFEKKRGEVLKFVRCPSWQYHVDFDGEEAIVYHHELKYW